MDKQQFNETLVESVSAGRVVAYDVGHGTQLVVAEHVTVEIANAAITASQLQARLILEDNPTQTG